MPPAECTGYHFDYHVVHGNTGEVLFFCLLPGIEHVEQIIYHAGGIRARGDRTSHYEAYFKGFFS